MVRMIIDRKTGKEVHSGDTLIRKDYKGFKHRYEVLEYLGSGMVWVKKLTQGDRWVYLSMPLASLQLDEVLL
jgi:hypothetical protein